MIYTLNTDGGARGNPGPAAAGIVLKAQETERTQSITIVEEFGVFLGTRTNNEAEYLALIYGLEKALEHSVRILTCFLDSELVVKQLNGLYKVKNANMKVYFDKIALLRKNFEKVEFKHIPREKNKEADKLVNETLDATK